MMKTNTICPCLASQSIACSLRRLLSCHACVGVALLTLTVFAFSSAQAAVTEAWVHRYNNVVSNSYDFAAKVVRDTAGDIIITGISDSKMVTLKYSGVDGSVLWQTRNGGRRLGDRSGAYAVAVDAHGNAVVTGYVGGAMSSAGGVPDETSDLYTAKYAATDGTLLWEKYYDGPESNYDVGYAVALDRIGNVVVAAGSIAPAGLGYFYTAKYAAENGALIWEKRHDSLAATGLVWVDSSDNVVIAGIDWPNMGGDFLAKYAAANGALLWDKPLNAPKSDYGFASALALDGLGNIVASGSSRNEAGNDAYYTAKYSGVDGSLLWDQRGNGPDQAYGYAQALAVDRSGNVVVTGISDSTVYTALYAATNGALLWEKQHRRPSGRFQSAYSVALDPLGNVVVTGYFTDESNGFYTGKYAAADGALLWNRHYSGNVVGIPEYGFRYLPYSMAVDDSGNVVLTGSSDSRNGTSYDFQTAKFANAAGELLWEKSYNGNPVNNYDQAAAVVVDSGGNVVVTGRSSNADGYYDYYTAKYAAVDGALLWDERYKVGTSRYNTYAASVVVNSKGDVAVTGGAYNGIAWDYYTAKYASANGKLMWEKLYNGPSNLQDFVAAMAVDGSGNVVVTGSTDGPTTTTDFYGDFYTAKYSGADGALLWEKRHGSPNISDRLEAVAADLNGDVVVSGWNSAGGYTAKYAAATGALVWEQRYPGSSHVALGVDGLGNVVVTGTDATLKYAAPDGALLWEKRHLGSYSSALAVDSKNNVLVAGTFSGGANGDDYSTAKYAAEDGSLLWQIRYNGPANLDDRPIAVRVDDRGNVVVTGTSASSKPLSGGLIHDYYTAKYAAGDGALLWEGRYNGPANGDDYPAGLALGPNGMVVVSGTSAGTGHGGSYDYATVVYRETLAPDQHRSRFHRFPSALHRNRWSEL
jgi:hypothetical protein